MSTDRAGYITGLRALADLLEAHDELPLPYNDIHWHFLSGRDDKADLARFARLIGGALTKNTYGDDSSPGGAYFELRGRVHGLTVSASAYRNQVCTRVVTGTREVTKTVPAPDAPSSSQAATDFRRRTAGRPTSSRLGTSTLLAGRNSVPMITIWCRSRPG